MVDFSCESGREKRRYFERGSLSLGGWLEVFLGGFFSLARGRDEKVEPLEQKKGYRK